MAGLYHASGTLITRMTLEVFMSRDSSDCLVETANLEETDTGDDSSEPGAKINPQM